MYVEGGVIRRPFARKELVQGKQHSLQMQAGTDHSRSGFSHVRAGRSCQEPKGSGQLQEKGIPTVTERFQVGVITGTHGLRGEVKVFPTTQDPSRFLDLEEAILQAPGGERRVGIRSVKFFKKFVILGFTGMDRIEDVEKLRGCPLVVDRSDAIPLEEGEYYVADILGLSVRREDGSEIGTLREVIETGANDVYAVAREGQKDLLLPAIDDCILEIRPEEGYMTVFVMPGLEDL